jgi:hypothetical protein
MRSFTIGCRPALPHYHYVYETRKTEMGEACNTDEEDEE